MEKELGHKNEPRIEKYRSKHLSSWQSSRSAVHVIKNTKDYHMHLTTLSDQKANIVIAASSIIVSLGISQIREMEGLAMVSLIILMTGASLALLLAIISVTPLFSKQTSKMTTESKGFNPFFFGHFTDLDLPEYTDYMIKVLKDEDLMYQEMIKDIYQMGVVLRDRKYKFLSWSYRVFFVGVLMALLTAVYSFF